MTREDPASIHLGHPAIDHDHQVFASLVAQLTEADDASFPELFAELVTHTRDHFAREEALMAASEFSATPEHTGEHRRVLGELNRMQASVERGLLPLARAYVTDMAPRWFDLHLRTMDSALVAVLRDQARGGH